MAGFEVITEDHQMADGFEIIISKLEQQKAAIDKALSALRDLGGMTTETPSPATAEPAGRKYKISDEVRERMRLGQQRRYAHLHKTPEPAPVATKTKPKFSPEARKKLALAMKRRWAAKRAALAATKKATKKGRKKAADNE